MSHPSTPAFAAEPWRLREAGHVAYFAGGCVRDELLGLTPKDYDVATDAPPDRVRKLFTNTQAVGAAFGVILVRHKKSVVEVATFRTDGKYLDGRRPEAVTFTTAEEDAKRRDFTINGMFLDPIENKVIDYVGGQRDLRRVADDPRSQARAQCPEHDATGPMLVEVEDLTGEGNAAAQRDGPNGVECRSHRREAVPGQRPGRVEPADCQQHDAESGGGREGIPIRRDEEQQPASEHETAERQRDADRPSHRVRTAVRRFERTDPLGGGAVDESRLSPASEPRRPF
jgi:hypothetical protein